MATLHKGEIGKIIEIAFSDNVDGQDVPLDISQAAVKEIRCKKPSGELVEFALAFVTDGTDGLARYITASASDLDEHGLWKLQGHISGAGFDWYTVQRAVLVGDAFDEP